MTTLGHPEEFQVESDQRLIINAIHWALGKPAPTEWAGKINIDVKYHGIRKTVPGKYPNWKRETYRRLSDLRITRSRDRSIATKRLDYEASRRSDSLRYIFREEEMRKSVVIFVLFLPLSVQHAGAVQPPAPQLNKSETSAPAHQAQ